MRYLFVLLLSGCVYTAGSKFTMQDANRIHNGMSREEVKAVMGGMPFQWDNNNFTYAYTDINRVSFAKQSKAVNIHFDENGKVDNAPQGGYFKVGVE